MLLDEKLRIRYDEIGRTIRIQRNVHIKLVYTYIYVDYVQSFNRCLMVCKYLDLGILNLDFCYYFSTGVNCIDMDIYRKFKSIFG